MKASELRIGNWIMSDECGFTTVNGSLIQFLETPKSLVTGFVEPIPLTEEWLLKFGFEYDGCEWFDFKSVGISLNNKRATQQNGEYYNQLRFPDYVHQLQNLYFALTGEELAIN